MSHLMTIDSVHFEILHTDHQQEDDEDDAAPVVTARLVFGAKGFRRTMVRNLVGFCVDVCRGAVARNVVQRLETMSP